MKSCFFTRLQWCALVLLVLCCASRTVIAQTPTMPQAPTNPEYSLTGIGIFGGADYRTVNANFSSLPGFQSCCNDNFGATQTLGWTAGIVFDHSLTNWLWLDIRASLLSTTIAFAQDEKVFVGVLGVGRDVTIRHALNMNLMNIAVEPSLKMRLLPIPITTTFAPSLYLQLGVNASATVRGDFRYEERIFPDTLVNFIDTQTGRASSTRNQQSGFIPRLNVPQLLVFAGLETEIYLEQLFPANWILAPFARYYYDVNGIIDGKLLESRNAIQAGVALKYRFITPITTPKN
jgi:hypothetical protein